MDVLNSWLQLCVCVCNGVLHRIEGIGCDHKQFTKTELEA